MRAEEVFIRCSVVNVFIYSYLYIHMCILKYLHSLVRVIYITLTLHGGLAYYIHILHGIFTKLNYDECFLYLI